MTEPREQHARLLLYSWARGSAHHKNKPTVPNRVTTSRRGPLSLDTQRKPHPRPHPKPRPSNRASQNISLSPRLIAPPSQYTSRAVARQKLLSGLPPASERPLDLVQEHINQGLVTCAELSSTMQTWPSLVDATLKDRKKVAMVDKVFSMPGIKLPQRETIHLPSLVPHLSSSDPTSPPPISISITYTKTTPTKAMSTGIPPVMITPTSTGNTAAAENHTSCEVVMATSQGTRDKPREGRRGSSLQPRGPQSSLAPAALRAANTHKLYPIESSVYLQGESISRHALFLADIPLHEGLVSNRHAQHDHHQHPNHYL